MSAEAARVYHEQKAREAEARKDREGDEPRSGDVHDGRGRDATRPGEIPGSGWKDIAYRLYNELSNDRVLLIAAGVTFYLLLALAPLLAALVSIYGLFLDPASIATQAEALAGVVPGGAVDILDEQLNRLAEAGQGTLGFAFVISLLIALWSANAGMKSLFEAMNVAYDEREERSFVRLTLITLCFTICLITALIALVVFNAAFTTFQGFIGLQLPNWLANTITIAAALFVLITFLAALYRYGPCRERSQWKWITPGAVFGVVGAALVSVLFSFYVANFGTYNATYGSLGTIVGFLTWLWLVMTMLILGAELNAEMEHQTARDTTTGSPQPMGHRGATVADDLGRSYGDA